ncbi:MAG: CAP domain-containing protein [Aridibacter sp.]
MFIKFLIQILIVTFLSISAIAQQSVSLSELKKSKTSESKISDSVKNQTKTKDTVKFTEFEQEVFEEVNNVRQNPLKYVDYLQEYKKMLKGKVLYRPNQSAYLMNEGASVIDETISDLQNATALRPLTASKLLTLAANNQLNDLKENPKLGHYGKDGSDFRKRLAKIGKSGKYASENINYKDKIARDVILSLIIDDGVKSRTHRKNILNPEYNLLGVSCGIANDNQMICVMVFADKFDEAKPSTQTVPIEVF